MLQRKLKMQQNYKKSRARIFDRIASDKKLPSKIQPKSPHKNVKFSEVIVDNTDSRKKHHSASILKKRGQQSLEKRGEKREQSVNSMGQNPLEDQSCENSNLNKFIKEEYINLVEISKKKGKFTDQLFPPVISSLFTYAGRKKNKYPNVKWMRVTEIFKKNELILVNPIGSKTLILPSTNLSAQYFSAAFNCIKSNKNILKKIFEDQKINEYGIYYVKIFQTNVWKYLIVDDSIPVLQNQSENIPPRPVFITCQVGSHSQKLEIWPFILQKAFAKYYSSYEALQCGNIYDFLQEITNKTCEQYNNSNTIAKDLQELYNNNDLISFGETKQQIKIPIQCNGTEKSNNKLSFILPNKQKVNASPSEMFQHFEKLYLIGSKNFTYVGQCPIKQIKQSISVRQFSLKAKSYCSLSLNQKDRRFFQQQIKYQYRWIRIIIVQKQFNGGYRWINGRYGNQKTLSIQSQLEPGDYYVIIMPEWGQKSYDLTLIIRAKVPAKLERKVYEDGMIQQACADLAQRYGRLNQLNSYICSYNCIHEDMGFIIQNINNQRVKGQIKIVRSIDGLKSNVEIEAVNKQFKNSKNIQIIIKNNSHFTVVLKMKGGIDKQFFRTFDFGGK